MGVYFQLPEGQKVNSGVKEVIKMGPTPGMPAFRYVLTDQEIDDLVEYVKVK